jgi:heme oxygenase (biliverdin-IX-beta and delta-forming)
VTGRHGQVALARDLNTHVTCRMARMHAASAMLLRLNTETRGEHSRADQPWLALLDADVTRARYLDHLVAIYGFEAPFEAAVALTHGVAERVQLRQRARSGLIVQDLLALGLTPSQIARLPQCQLDMPFRDPAEALGWMYVVERATLLHDAVRRYLEDRLEVSGACGYLSAYDGVAGARWQDLGRALDEVAAAPPAPDQIVAATRSAFACHRHWFTH